MLAESLYVILAAIILVLGVPVRFYFHNPPAILTVRWLFFFLETTLDKSPDTKIYLFGRLLFTSQQKKKSGTHCQKI